MLGKKKFIRKNILGRGGFGIVWEYKLESTWRDRLRSNFQHKFIAVKHILLPSAFKKEAEIIRKLKEKKSNCALAPCIIWDDMYRIIMPRMMVSTDYMKKMEAQEKIEAATRICIAVSRILICISENSQLYLDIKPENIFVEEEKTQKIYLGDLGSVTEKKDIWNAPNTRLFLPPCYLERSGRKTVLRYEIDMMQLWAIAMTFMYLLDQELFQTACRPDDTEQMAKELRDYMEEHQLILDQARFIKNILQDFVNTLTPNRAASKEFKIISILKLRF